MKLSIFTASIILTTNPAFAEREAAPGSPDVVTPSMLGDSKFRLHAERFITRDLPNFELKDWPQKPEVNAAVVEQIDAVKTAVPEWHGLHHMIPGSAGSNK
jgi:hypothetical protein